MLLDANARINQQNASGLTPVNAASVAGSVGVVRVLCERNAEIESAQRVLSCALILIDNSQMPCIVSVLGIFIVFCSVLGSNTLRTA